MKLLILFVITLLIGLYVVDSIELDVAEVAEKRDNSTYAALVCAGIETDYKNLKPDCDSTLTAAGEK